MPSLYQAAKAVVPRSIRETVRNTWDLRVKPALRMLANPDAQSPSMREARNNLVAELKMEQVVSDAAAKFAAFKGKKNLKLHLGAGTDIRRGWVNIDLSWQTPPSVIDSDAGTVFINYDLRRRLPLESGSCELVYSSHFFEHLEYRHGLALLAECYRVLQAGGVFRISLPNFKGLFKAYLAGDHDYVGLIDIYAELPDLEAGTDLLVDHVNYGVYQNGEHKCIYDEQKILLLLKRLGYTSVCESAFKPGVDPDNTIRRKYSFYVEAVK